MYVIGLMSGTSMDGVDVALVNIEGVNETTKVELIEFVTYPFARDLKSKIMTQLTDKKATVSGICSLDFELGAYFAKAVIKLCQLSHKDVTEIEFIASHGQTLYHLPTPKDSKYVASTLQLGNASVLAEKTGITVISDFRSRDIAVGGQGAPIVPLTEALLYREKTKTMLFQNIGGIGNVSIFLKDSPNEKCVAFDTGPGNMMIDEVVRRFYGKEYDKGGEIAAKGKVNHGILSMLLLHPYFKELIPKTTGREVFGSQFVDEILSRYILCPEDWVATLTAYTAESIILGVEEFLQGDEEKELVIAGGGSRNKTLLSYLIRALPNVNVVTLEELGNNSEAKEAVAMAVLGNQTYHKQPGNLPSATGAGKAVSLGSITYY
ncbi:anhydro-N-acetylmuramic acid kinase AnmK [Vagococcus fessus]|nr:anhydro-N-acetylmuramic acid kinase AnmK [Vagococcus fessus]